MFIFKKMPKRTFLILLIALIFVISFSILIKSDNMIKDKKTNTQTSETATKKSQNLTAKNADLKIPELSAESAISIAWNTKTDEKITLLNKNSDAIKPIASITKIFLVYLAYKEFTYSSDDLNASTTDERLNKVLVESNNSEAENLISSENIDGRIFLAKMNSMASKLGLYNTHFNNLTGLDREGGNLSNAEDLTKFAIEIYKNNPIIWQKSLIKYFIAKESSGDRLVTTTNKLLLRNDLPFEIIGGKTGETPQAKQTLILLTKSPCNDIILINALLRSDDRDSDMIKVLNFVNNSYECK